ncbi:MAG: hypothetical protein QNJ29_15345 [Rhizobiaceae bacterium]|nr:hypothetical protein [Rhizobiaceae bacterium]
MSDLSINQVTDTVKTSWVETLIYRALVVTLFFVSALALSVGRMLGARGQGPLWREAREAAYAVAGYAFKH